MEKPKTKDIRKESIYKASLSLLNKQGYADTSMEDIAVQSGISKANLYHHFTNKKELYSELIKYYRNQYLGKIQNIIKKASSAREVLENIFSTNEKMFDQELDNNRSAFEFLHLSMHDEEIRQDTIDFTEHFMEIIAQVIDLGKATGEFKTKHASQELAAHLIRAFEGLKVIWLFTKNNKSLLNDNKQFLHFFLDLLYKED